LHVKEFNTSACFDDSKWQKWKFFVELTFPSEKTLKQWKQARKEQVQENSVTAGLRLLRNDKLNPNNTFMRAKELINRAYQLPEGQRDQLINVECAEDLALRDEVKWMLEGLRAPEDDFLEQPAVEHAIGMTAELKVPAARRYTLLRPLGEGGTGMVYLAERVENKTRQVVAIKLLNPMALRNQSAVTHFLSERELLARLNHPGIARLIDAGALEDGQPFLAMEYVEGKTIDRYCKEKSLSLASRLQLFLKVCESVQYAHQQFVIHRDIKPGNVLVTEQGTPKLVDFGIARALVTTDVEVTATAYRMMSLAYASPEQVSGHALSTSTDVYSLGVLLYELVTGETPWGNGDNNAMLATRISAVEPELASKAYKKHVTNTGSGTEQGVVRSKWGRHNLPADLDAILLKALRHRPQDRYATAQALADDVDRLLGHYPVEARRGQHAYRWRKFGRRHWPWLSGVAVMLVLSIGFGIDRSIQLDRTRAEEAKVRSEVARVKEVSNFLSELFTQPAPEFTHGKEVTARALVDHGANRLRKLLDADPSTKITLLNTLAHTYLSLGDLNQASDLSAQAVQLAHDAPGVSKQLLMDTLLNSAGVERQLPSGPLLKKYAVEAMALGQSDPSIKPIDLATAMQWFAYSEFLLGSPILQIEQDYRASLLKLQTVAPDSDEMTTAQFTLSLAQTYDGKAEDAWIEQQSAEKLMERLHGPNHPETLRSKGLNGFILAQMGEAAQGEAILRPVLAAQTSLLGLEHAQTIITMRYLSVVLMAQGKWSEAEECAHAELELTRKFRKYESLSTIFALMTEAGTLLELRRFDEAERLYRETKVVIEKTIAVEETPRWKAVADVYLARAQFGNGKVDAAKELLTNALRELPDMPDTLEYRVRAWLTLAQIGAAQHDAVAAEKAYQIAFELAPTATSYQPLAALEFGRYLSDRGQFDRSGAILAPLVERLKKRMPPDAPILANAISAMDHLHAEENRGIK
jgi:tetratricopeptide (TPR) repeat protein/tRNA A-37 threonylcarbamoyl transferase component Bud32